MAWLAFSCARGIDSLVAQAHRVSVLFVMWRAIPKQSFDNRWSAELTKDFRYRFVFEDQSKPWIVDSQGTGKWGLASITDDRRTPEDYILICRLPHSQTGRLMIMVAGLAVYGTEAGGRIVSDPKLLEPVLQNLPKGWGNRNLEMVMKVEVVGGGPSLPTLVAAHTW